MSKVIHQSENMSLDDLLEYKQARIDELENQIDLLNEEALSRVGVVALLEKQLAEKDAQTASALKFLRSRITGFSVSNNAYRIIDEEIMKYDPAFKSDTVKQRRKFVVDRNDALQDLNANLSTANARIEEAVKVIEFYGDKLSWKQICNCGDGSILIDIEDDDQEDLGRIYGGKRARQFLETLKKDVGQNDNSRSN